MCAADTARNVYGESHTEAPCQSDIRIAAIYNFALGAVAEEHHHRNYAVSKQKNHHGSEKLREEFSGKRELGHIPSEDSKPSREAHVVSLPR